MRSIVAFVLVMAAGTLTPGSLAAQPAAPEKPLPEVTPPRLSREPDRSVPDVALPGESGRSVMFELEVDATGKVTSARVIEPTGSALEKVLTERAMALSLEPARRRGVPIAVRIRFSFDLAWPEHGVTDPAEAPAGPAAANAGAREKPERATRDRARTPASVPEAATGRRRRPEARNGTPTKGDDGANEELVYEAEATIEAPAREVTRHTLRKEVLTKIPGTRGDALRAVEVLPGVSRPAAGDGAPILRGASSFESLVQLDGSTIPVLYHFQSLTSVYSSRLLESVDVYPSNFSVRYGRVHGGVIAAQTRSPKRDRFHAVVDVSLLDSSALVEAPLGERTGIALGARRSNIDFYFDSIASSDEFSAVVAPVYWDYQALVEHDLSSRHTLRLSSYGSRDRLELFFDDPVAGDPTLRGEISGTIEFHQLQASIRSRLGASTQQELSLTLGRQLFSQRVGPEMDADLRATTLAARGEWRSSPSSNLTLTAGFDFEGTYLDGTYRGSRPPQLEGNPEIYEPQANSARVDMGATQSYVTPALYAELGWLPAQWVRVVPGVRVDYFQLFDSWSVDPRLAVRMDVSRATTLKGGVGLFTQAPLYYQGLDEIGNSDLDPERALHASAGVEQRFGRELEVGAEVFAKRITHRVVATRDGAAPFFVNDGVGRVHGLELSAKAQPDSDTFAYLAYTLSRSERRDHGDPWRLFDYDQTHNLVTSLNRDLGRGWEVGARFRLVSGNPLTPVVGSVYDSSSGVYRPLYGGINSARNPTYYQLDLSAQKTWSLSSVRLTAYLDLQNATNAQNAEGVRYSYDYSNSETTSGLPIFPNLGLRGEL